MLSEEQQVTSIVPAGGIVPYPTEEVMRRGRLAFTEVGAIGEVSQMTGGEHWKQLYALTGSSSETNLSGELTVRPSTPANVISTTDSVTDGPAQPVPVSVRKPLAVVAQPQQSLQEAEEDLAFDLDLNPGQQVFPILP